jgi:hypothetical protein
METSAAGGKKLLYVGGLAEEVDAKVLQAAFIPFGDIVEVNIFHSISKFWIFGGFSITSVGKHWQDFFLMHIMSLCFSG